MLRADRKKVKKSNYEISTRIRTIMYESFAVLLYIALA